MSRFLLLNLKDFDLNQDITQCIQPQTLVCICCLEKNIPFISLSTCKHSEFLNSFAKPALEPSMNVICFQCHIVLKKIELFRIQVEVAFKILGAKTFGSLKCEAFKNMNLEITKIENIHLPPAKYSMSQIKQISKTEHELKEEQEKEPVLPVGEIKTEPHDEMDISIDTTPVFKDSSVSPVPLQKSPIPTQVPTTNLEKSNTNSDNNDKNMPEGREEANQKIPYASAVYKCDLCIIGFYSQQQVEDHFVSTHREGRKKKEKDTLEPPKPGILRKLLSKTTIEDYQCLKCDMVFKSSCAHKTHVARYHWEGLQCDHCKKRFANKSTLATHLRLHLGPLPREKCPICHKMVRAIHLKLHIERHQNKSRYECTKCKKVFLHLVTYQAHLKYSRAHAPDGVFKFPCPMCNKGYPTKEAMQDHFNYQHLGKTAHKCPTCDKPIASRANVELHMMRVHGKQKEKPRKHVCQICGKGFFHKRVLNQHELIHSEDRPLSCDICERTFKYKASLYTHRKRVHKVFPNKRAVEFMENKPNST